MEESLPHIAHACNYTTLTTYFSFPAPGERRTADDGDVAGDVVGGRAEPGRPVALVNGDNDDGGRASGYRRRHDSGGWHRTGLLRKRQTHDDGSRNGANGVQLPVWQRREIGVGRVSPTTHRDLLLFIPYADALHHWSGALS